MIDQKITEQKDRGDKSNTRKCIKHACAHDSPTFDENQKVSFMYYDWNMEHLDAKSKIATS